MNHMFYRQSIFELRSILYASEMGSIRNKEGDAGLKNVAGWIHQDSLIG